MIFSASLQGHLSALENTNVVKIFEDCLQSAPDAPLFASRVEQYANFDRHWRKLTPEDAKDLVSVFQGSSFLSRFLIRHPGEIVQFRDFRLSSFDACTSPKELRMLKYRGLLKLFLQRCREDLSIEEEWKFISDLADRIIVRSLEISRPAQDINGDLHVIAMGKLGAQELNVSSDVDLVYLSENIEANDPHFPQILQWAERHAQMLSEITGEGYLFRVDLRLRPEGSQSPLVHTRKAIRRYFEERGTTWERAAWLRARAIESLEAQKLIEELKPFLYRHHLSYGTIDDLREMKMRLETSIQLYRHAEEDIKLGTGGIREIEFIAQAFQLIFGGKHKPLRTRNTLTIFNELIQIEFLEEERALKLMNAYKALRSIEHAVQWDEERQTHTTPLSSQSKDWNRIQLLCPSFPDIQTSLVEHRKNVQRHFEEVFLPERRKDTIAFWELPLDRPLKKEEIQKHLQKHGISNSEDTTPIILKLREVVPKLKLTKKGERQFRRLLPHLIEELAKISDPDQAINGLLSFLISTRGRSTIYTLLAQNPPTLRLLLQMFGLSDFLSSNLSRHPELLDALVMRAHLRPLDDRTSLQNEVKSVLESNASKENALNELREIKQTQMLRIALHDLSGEVEWETIANELSSLAEEMIRACLTLSRRECDPEKRIRMATIGLGSLGAKEMSYTSDLDLIFLIDPRSEEFNQEMSLGMKWVQRLVSALSLPTEAGTLYKVDARLRPSGNQGTLISSCKEFARYHEMGADLWERQALLKARPIQANDSLQSFFQNQRRTVCFQHDDSVLKNLKAMRTRLEKELGHETQNERNIKLGRGGLADIDFLIASFQLRHGRNHLALQEPGSLNALKTMLQANLLSPTQERALREGFIFLHSLENRIRLHTNQPISRFSLSEISLNKIAGSFRLGPGRLCSAKELRQMYEHTTERIRSTFNELLSEG